MRDYAELIKALRMCKMSIPCNGCPFYSRGDMPSKECGTMNDAAADAIEKLLAAVPKWISVEERLPEAYIPVLFFIPWNKSCMVGHANKDKTIYLEGYGECCDFSITKPSHWMPLQEAPKEVSEDA